MIYRCCNETRRERVRTQDSSLNGIDILEVLDLDTPVNNPDQKKVLRQRTLLLRFLKPALDGFPPRPILSEKNISIEGGERIKNITIEWAYPASALPPDDQLNKLGRIILPEERAYFENLRDSDYVMVIRTSSAGDHSIYRLTLKETDRRVIDPQLAEVEFSFKVECPSEFDCKDQTPCAVSPYPIPEINYLAKDYASFRRLILDRLTQLVPGWRERSSADLGVALAELLAYVGDQLSYQQDAIATEAYLETARRRTSLRRHALLVDYQVHEGCNARTWVHIEVDSGADAVTVPLRGLQFLTKVPQLGPRILPRSFEYETALNSKVTVFEPVPEDDTWPIVNNSNTRTFHSAHNELYFYTWGNENCCLPKEATSATLQGHFPCLEVGDVLIFEEVIGPLTGNKGDADPIRRHAVRLTTVASNDDGVDGKPPLTDPLNGEAITEITWAQDDALPFPLCISATTDYLHNKVHIKNVSVVRGNVLLVDHGRTIEDEDLGVVPPDRFYPVDRDADRCKENIPDWLPLRFRPVLKNAPLTYRTMVQKIQKETRQKVAAPYDNEAAAVSAFATRDDEALPVIRLIVKTKDATILGAAGPCSPLEGTASGLSQEIWIARRDLLNSSPSDKHFVIEAEDNGIASIRFGDGQHGLRPDADTHFLMTYRIGNGIAGNIGADSIAHIVGMDARIKSVRNPLPARGGLDAETAEQIRRRAPQAFRKQERAVTPEDYRAVTERNADVQRAAATLRWTGSWHTVFLTVDRLGGKEVDDNFRNEVKSYLDRYRMAAQDVEIDSPTFVSLEMTLEVCVKDDYFRSDIRKRLSEVLSNRVLPDGRRGLFHPDNFSFGQTLYASSIYAAARKVDGVASIQIKSFKREGIEDQHFQNDGQVTFGRLEIARLDNDPNFPERGLIHFELFGGK
jgi:hypothetical protein